VSGRTRSAGRAVGFALAALIGAGCGDRAVNESPSSTATILVAPTCDPTDQDRYVYRPARLQAVLPCVRVAGTIVASSTEADGDVHLDVRLDDAYVGFLNAGNLQEGGNLVVEPVCRFAPMQAEAIRVCASDPDPLTGALPGVGEHVWLEGRYALDLQHHAWAELHPLYRWGRVEP